MKRALSAAAETAMFARFVSLVERFDRPRTNLVQVLTYHRIDDPRANPDLVPATLSATPAVFERQMAYLAARCRPATIDQVLDAHAGRKRLPHSAVLVTFDDAYDDFARHAWPILRRYDVPAVLFVPTGFPDQPQRAFWWDRLYQAFRDASAGRALPAPWEKLSLTTAEMRLAAHARIASWIKTLPHEVAMDWLAGLFERWQLPPARSRVLGWSVLRGLAADGLAIGAHTQTHPLLNRVSVEAAYAEAAGSLADLRREIGDVPPVFAYPGNRMNFESQDAVRRAGYQLAFGGRRGINNLDRAESFCLRRNHIGTDTSHNVFRARLLPWAVHFNRWRR